VGLPKVLRSGSIAYADKKVKVLDAAPGANMRSERENNMRSTPISYMVGFCFAGCLLLQSWAIAILFFAGEKPRLKSFGGAILRYSSWVAFALPVLILAGFLTENLNHLALMSYVYPIGVGTLCVFVSLYLKVE